MQYLEFLTNMTYVGLGSNPKSEAFTIQTKAKSWIKNSDVDFNILCAHKQNKFFLTHTDDTFYHVLSLSNTNKHCIIKISLFSKSNRKEEDFLLLSYLTFCFVLSLKILETRGSVSLISLGSFFYRFKAIS